MIPRDFQAIDQADVQAVVATATSESATLEFKREAPPRTDAGRHELCADVSAMANALGGDIVLGVEEDGEGKAARVIPWVGNQDDEVRRLSDVIANGIEPRVPGLQLRSVVVAGGHVFVIRTPQSWSAPHRVKTNQHFFVREGARRRQLDMPEIRAGFVRSERLAEEIRSFRADRVGKILVGETPVSLVPAAITVLHLFPLTPIASSSIDPTDYQRGRELPLIGAAGRDFRINLDGAVSFRPIGERGSGGYTQLFRNGRIEATRVFANQLQSGRYGIPSSSFEVELMAFYRAIVPELVRLQLGPPTMFAYSILRARAAELGIARRWDLIDARDGTFDRDIVLLPEIVVGEFTDAHVALRPMFDLVWQSVGIPKSWNYDDGGNWIQR